MIPAKTLLSFAWIETKTLRIKKINKNHSPLKFLLSPFGQFNLHHTSLTERKLNFKSWNKPMWHIKELLQMLSNVLQNVLMLQYHFYIEWTNLNVLLYTQVTNKKMNIICLSICNFSNLYLHLKLATFNEI